MSVLQESTDIFQGTALVDLCQNGEPSIFFSYTCINGGTKELMVLLSLSGNNEQKE